MGPTMQGVRSLTEDQKGPQKVFVYGTLKKGFGNHMYHLGQARDLGCAVVEGLLFHLGGFPALCVEEAFGNVSGEVYETSWDHIWNMDILEGVGRSFYDRVQVKVKPHGTVWTYVFSRERVEKSDRCGYIIPSGVWRGSDSPTIKWAGFGKGALPGKFETNSSRPDEIKVGDGTGNFKLIREAKESPQYLLIEGKEGTVLGRYRFLRDFLENTNKPTLRLTPDTRVVPPQNPTVTPREVVHPTVREIMEGRVRNLREQQNPNMPMVWQGDLDNTPIITLPPVPEEPKVPQAVRLLQMKYGPA